MHDYEPKLHPVKILSLRPTQITIGMREVVTKRRGWQDLDDDSRPEFLGNHMVPVVLGPNGKSYVIDHHHLVRALYEEKVDKILISIVADLSKLKRRNSGGYWTIATGSILSTRKASARTMAISPTRSKTWSTIPTGHSRARSAMPVALPSRQHPTANSSGRIS